MMAGAGVPTNLVIGGEDNPVGIATDVVPTIAELLGIKNEVTSAGLIDAEVSASSTASEDEAHNALHSAIGPRLRRVQEGGESVRATRTRFAESAL